MTHIITSIKNEKVKYWKKLHKRKERVITQTFLIEGFHLVEAAFKSNWSIKELIIQEGVSLPEWARDIPTVVVKNSVFAVISQTDTPQGIAAIVIMKQLNSSRQGPVLLIDAIQDPGNLGTIIRTADAAGFSEVILGEGTVDVFNDKVVRATQGSLFHIPLRQADLLAEIPLLKEAGFGIWVTALTEADNYTAVKPVTKTALIVGNEGHGVRSNIMDIADKRVTIPIYGQAESLNVSVAAGILMYYLRS
ncbi:MULTISPECIES: RNA methyltransferase [Clostridia]|uniref:TrmH family RNA methyltransferase n=1 Tax=Clostridia TaxID=186801 RepID=UPI0018F500DA|nr:MULTISPECIES: RNA methyltransferase [Clostridia]